MSSPTAIYIRVPGGYGDNLMATAVVEGLKARHPDLRIFILTKRMDIFENNPHVAMCYNTRTILKKNPSLFERAVTIGYPSYEQLRQRGAGRHYIDCMYDNLPLEVEKRCYRPNIYLTPRERSYRHRYFEKIGRPLVAISPLVTAEAMLKTVDLVRALAREYQEKGASGSGH